MSFVSSVVRNFTPCRLKREHIIHFSVEARNNVPEPNEQFHNNSKNRNNIETYHASK